MSENGRQGTMTGEEMAARAEELLAEAKAKRRIVFAGSKYKELMEDDEIKPRPVAVQGFVKYGEITMLVADPKMGKSWLMSLLALKGATGGTFFGKKVNQSTVVYIDTQMGKADEKERASVLAQVLFPDNHLEDFPLYFIDGDGSPTPPTLDNLEEGLEAFLEGYGIKFENVFVILDMFGDVTGEMEFNAYEKVGAALQKIKPWVRRRNIALVTTHHTNKSGKYNGSINIPGSVDNMFYLRWAVESERKKGRVKNGKAFVVLEDYIARRRMTSKLLHLKRTLIEWKEGQAPDNLDAGKYAGILWGSCGFVGEEEVDDDGEEMPVEEEGMDGAAKPGDAPVGRSVKQENMMKRAQTVLQCFDAVIGEFSSNALAERYGKKAEVGKEMSRKAVSDAVALGWIRRENGRCKMTDAGADVWRSWYYKEVGLPADEASTAEFR